MVVEAVSLYRVAVDDLFLPTLLRYTRLLLMLKERF
jgi:hypothetical protein